MSLAGEGKNLGRSHMLRLAERADVSKREVAGIIDQVQTAVVCWKDFADRAGVSQVSTHEIAQSLPRWS